MAWIRPKLIFSKNLFFSVFVAFSQGFVGIMPVGAKLSLMEGRLKRYCRRHPLLQRQAEKMPREPISWQLKLWMKNKSIFLLLCDGDIIDCCSRVSSTTLEINFKTTTGVFKIVNCWENIVHKFTGILPKVPIATLSMRILTWLLLEI